MFIARSRASAANCRRAVPQNVRQQVRRKTDMPQPPQLEGERAPPFDWRYTLFLTPFIATGVAVIVDKYVNEERGYWRAYRAFGDKIVVPLMRQFLDAEDAHNWAVKLAALRLGPKDRGEPRHTELATTVCGLNFPNVVGLAAGFDKHAEAIDPLLFMGFGFVEIGSVTPQPQPGNDKPRMFRLLEDRGIINRCGFNSHGIEVVKGRLDDRIEQHVLGRKKPKGLVGINVGKNKWVGEADAASDFSEGIRRLGQYGDYVVVNVSSPNTPGLRDLQRREAITAVVLAASAARHEARIAAGRARLPLFVKIAPDLDEQQKADIAAVALSGEVDGLIVSNTTISRPETLKSPNKVETGGLSGAPLKDLSTKCVSDMYRLTGGKVPLIGVGGIGTGADAYEKIKAGASLVQVYSMLVYEGSGAIVRIKAELAELLKKDGYRIVGDAVGADHRVPKP